jgi:Sec-independent protein secretion pathway component TatC
VCADSKDFEVKLIESLMESSKDTLLKMFRVFMVNILSTLNLLNCFQMPAIYTGLNDCKIVEHEAWKEIDKYIQESHVRYSQALRTGIYA